MRENIFTVFAKFINEFADHTITKEQLFKNFVSLVEQAEENEIKERENHEKAINDWSKSPITMEAKRPYSNYEEAINMLKNITPKK